MFVFATLPVALISGNRDSLVSAHYKVKFSVQAKTAISYFDYHLSTGYYYQGKFASDNHGYRSVYNSPITSLININPELKVDFELPVWLKLTCGVFENKISFKTGFVDRDYFGNKYAGVNYTGYYPTKEYLIDETQIESIGTFLGLGFSRQYDRFNFDLDYSFSSNRVFSGYSVRSVYDENFVYLKKETVHIMDDYIHQFGFLFFTHNVSASFSYRIMEKTSIKFGYQFSKNSRGIEDRTVNNYSTFNKMRSHSFIIGVGFSIK